MRGIHPEQDERGKGPLLNARAWVDSPEPQTMVKETLSNASSGSKVNPTYPAGFFKYDYRPS
jgi:hypothetical protein